MASVAPRTAPRRRPRRCRYGHRTKGRDAALAEDMKSFAGFVVGIVLARVFANGFARRPFAEEVFEDALHLDERHAVAQPVELNREGAQFVDENALLGEIAGPAVRQFILPAGWVKFLHGLTCTLGSLKRQD